MAIRDELIELEQGFWKATSDPDYYRQHMADDGLAVFSEGIMEKAAAVQVTGAGSTNEWTDIRIDEPQMIQLADDVVALVYRGSAKRDGEPYAANTASVYVRRGGRWQMMLHQQSKLTPVPASP